MIRSAPASLSLRAMTRPSPRELPVTKATRPRQGPIRCPSYPMVVTSERRGSAGLSVARVNGRQGTMSRGRASIRERRLVQAIGLVMPTTHADRSIHRTVVLECPPDLRAPIAEVLGATEQLEVHEGIDAAMAKLGPNTERHHANLVHAP